MPDKRQLRVIDPIWTKFALEFAQDKSGAVADIIFPETPGEDSGTYWYYDANNMFRHYDGRRGDPAEAVAIDWKLGTSTYKTDDFAWKAHVTDKDRRISQFTVGLEQDAVRFITEASWLDREIRARDIVASTSAADLALNASGRPNKTWFESGCDPIGDVQLAKTTFQKKTGKRPTHMLWPKTLWDGLFTDLSDGAGGILRAKLMYTMQVTATMINPNLIGQYFDIPNVLVADTIFSDSALTNSVVSPSTGITSGTFVWDVKADGSTAQDQVMFFYVDPQAGPKGFTYGKKIVSEAFGVTRWREEKLRTDWFEVNMAEAHKVIASSALLRMEIL